LKPLKSGLDALNSPYGMSALIDCADTPEILVLGQAGKAMVFIC
jgi:hypothetical protein